LKYVKDMAVHTEYFTQTMSPIAQYQK